MPRLTVFIEIFQLEGERLFILYSFVPDLVGVYPRRLQTVGHSRYTVLTIVVHLIGRVVAVIARRSVYDGIIRIELPYPVLVSAACKACLRKSAEGHHIGSRLQVSPVDGDGKRRFAALSIHHYIRPFIAVKALLNHECHFPVVIAAARLLSRAVGVVIIALPYLLRGHLRRLQHIGKIAVAIVVGTVR